jgi:hypothetical protein
MPKRTPALALVTPNAPGYAALRMGADWASAVRDVPLRLRYDPETGHMAVGGSSGPGLTLLTRAYAKRPRVKRITFEVESYHRGKLKTASIELDGESASALVWGESAVEKFMVSYYAEAAGENAPRFLERLFDAWYCYPSSVVQVCALAYLCGTRAPPEGTRLSLAATVGLVCLETASGTLRLLSLDEFAARYTSSMPRNASPPPEKHAAERERGWQVGDEVESIVARDCAEFVSGLRGRFISFLTEGRELYPELYPTGEPVPSPATGATFQFAAAMSPVRGDRPAPSRVIARVKALDGKTYDHEIVPATGDPASIPDSLFWSDGGVEKFMLPYYGSVKGWTAPIYTALMMAKWEGLVRPDETDLAAGLDAMKRMIPDITGGPAAARDEEPVSPVYGLVHLPRSEYTSSPGMALEARTVFLAASGRETVRHVLHAGPDLQRGAKRSRKSTSRAR